MAFQSVLYALRGTVRIRVRGAAIERFLNLCSRHDIQLRQIVRVDFDELHATVSVQDFRKLRTYMGRTGCRVRLLEKNGAPFLFRKLRKRYMLFGGLALIALLCFGLTNFVWSIRLILPDGYSSFEVNRQLTQLGIHTGAYIHTLDLDRAKIELRGKVPGIELVTMTLHGNRMEIILHESKAQPEMLDSASQTSVVATKTGVITSIHVFEGTALKKVGDLVQQGEMLVSSVAMPTTEDGEARLVHATAEVEARTWYEITLRRALPSTMKQYTGRQKTQFALAFGNRRINLYFGSSISDTKCDKIKEESKIVIADNLEFPIRLISQTYAYYALLPSQPPENLREQMESDAVARLAASIDGTITATQSAYRELPGGAELTLYAECREQIGLEVVDTQELPEAVEGEKANDGTESTD